MWTLFKIINFIWLMSSTYMWMTTYVPVIQISILVNVLMIVCLSFLPIELKFDRHIGKILLAIAALEIWIVLCDGAHDGLFYFLNYIPVLWLIMLPREYKKDILHFVTKWYAIMLACGLVEYFILLVASLPSLGGFVQEGYEPFTNYGFYIKTTYDYGTFERFNAFFLEPGHQALLSTFLLMANSFDFKKNHYNIILLVGVIFSFSLAGYLLLAVGWALYFVKNVKRAVFAIGLIAVLVTAALSWNAGDNALNELIISRLEYDSEKGIAGNNRYFHNTDYVYERTNKKSPAWTSVQNQVNMKLVGGAGFKIFVIKYGWIGVILAALLYLSLIPRNADKKYTFNFLIVLSLCFMQRAYPDWYSWLFPYVLGIYLHTRNSGESEEAGEENETVGNEEQAVIGNS